MEADCMSPFFDGNCYIYFEYFYNEVLKINKKLLYFILVKFGFLY